MSIWRRKFDKIQVGRRQFRIEFNWNTLTTFMENAGMTFGQIDELENLNAAQFISLLYEGILEGCSIEKKKFPYSLEDFTAMLTPQSISELTSIFQSQNTIGLSKYKKVE